MSKKLWALLSLLVVASMVFAACGNQPTATATSAPATSTSTSTSTSTPTEPPTATATVYVNHGTEEMKKINELIMDGGPDDYFKVAMDETAATSEGTIHYTEGHRELVFYRVASVPHAWVGDKHLAWTLGTGVKYFRYQIPEGVDLEELVMEIDQVLPEGAHLWTTLYGISSTPIVDDFFSVTFDYAHEVDSPANTFNPAWKTNTMKNGATETFSGMMLITFTCTDSTTETHVVAKETFTSTCDMSERQSLSAHYGPQNAPRTGTEEENLRLMQYLMYRSDELADGADVERYSFMESAYADWQPLADFAETHILAPTPTNTPLPTSTRTPRPTATATINMTVVGTVTASTSEVSCSNNDQDVTYTVTGPLLGVPYCAEGLTYQDEPVDTLVISGPDGLLLITLDRVGGNGMYAVVIDNVPTALGTPTFTLTGTSIATGHAQKTVTDDVLEAVMNSSVVTLDYTVGEFTVTAEAWLK